ncbi:ATP-binding protein [Chloroflexota bacterium]
MNQLRVQLILAFTLVVLVAVGAIAFLIVRTTDTQFRRYITNSGMEASGRGFQQLVNYYEEQGSWDGIGSLLEQGVVLTDRRGLPLANPDRRPGRPGGRLDAILADSDGQVVYDTTGETAGKRLKAGELSRAMAITNSPGQEVIGYLLLSLPGGIDRLGQLEQQFLDRMRTILIVGAAVAVLVGLAIGVLLSRNLTAPLQRLAGAARAVAGGDLKQRVPVEGSVEMVEVAQAFNEMTATLEASERQRQNMVADVAHELRTPLTVVQGNLRAILDDLYALDKAEISRVYDETLLLGRLVDDLRELALADAGQLSLNPQPTDLVASIQSTVENLAPAAEAGGVTLSAQVNEKLPAVLADPYRISQVLRNLLVNALRYTPSGGSVTVTAVPLGSAVEITVADTGEGIDPGDLPHVFERFWRGDPARSRAGGSGLGLSVAQSLVQAQGGRIWVESKPGSGSTFRFTLPMAPSATDTEADSSWGTG